MREIFNISFEKPSKLNECLRMYYGMKRVLIERALIILVCMVCFNPVWSHNGDKDARGGVLGPKSARLHNVMPTSTCREWE